VQYPALALGDAAQSALQCRVELDELEAVIALADHVTKGTVAVVRSARASASSDRAS